MKTIKLERLNACCDAIEWARKQKSSIEAWNNCPRGDWMLWIASKVGVDKRLLTLAKGKCAETVIHLMKDQRSKDAVKAAIDYGNRLIDDNQLKTAYVAATYVAYAGAATYVAYAGAAADAYAGAAAKKNNQMLTASICREVLTKNVLMKYKKLRHEKR